MNRTRIAIAVPGILLGLFGIFRLLTQIDVSSLFVLLLWLVGALVIHDGILAPTLVGIGVGISHIAPRARKFVQGGLITAALVTVVAVPMIYRAHSQPKGKAILEQNFAANLSLLLLIILVGTVLLYVASVLRNGARGQARSDTNSRASADQDSTTE